MRRYSITFIAIALLTVNLVFPGLALAEVKFPPQTLSQIQTSVQSISPKAAIERLFTTEQVQSDWFASVFLAQVSVAQLQQIITSLKTQLGTYLGVQENGKDYLVMFTQGSVPTKIVLNARGQITGLLFQPPSVRVGSLSEAIAAFKALPGKTSFLVKEGKSTRAALNATTPLSVGSAFKLAVLKALKSQIASKQRTWTDVVTLQPEWKSLPSGMLQTWPDNSFLTVQTLAALMISLSDNTATDSLINLIGRQSIESISPRNRPFLTTRELFVLKGSRNQDLLKRYRSSKETQRRALLKEVAKRSLPDVSEFEGTHPTAIDVEWFFTSLELCGLMEEVADLPLTSINPGIANTKDWQRVAFKGGSEPGVLNLTTWLQAKNGKQYCVVATWNNGNAPVDESKFFALYSGTLAKLASDQL